MVSLTKNRQTHTITCTFLYCVFVESKQREPMCISIRTEEYSDIFRLPFDITTETELQRFHYKIIHIIMSCKKQLLISKLVTV